MPASVDVGVVGAGIGGLTLALACRHFGHQVTLYERAEALSPVGAGIQLGANATRVLHALGLSARLRAVSIAPVAIHLRGYRTGALIAARPLGEVSEHRYGAPYYQLHRADLQQVLLAAVTGQSSPVRLGHEVTHIESRDGVVDLTFADGHAARHDVVVGADGIHSIVQQTLFGSRKPEFIGNTAWRTLLPIDKVPTHLHGHLGTVYMGPRGHLVTYWVNSGRSLNVVAVAEVDHWTRESWVEPGDVDDMRAFYTDWSSDVQALLAAADSCSSWALYDRQPLSQWTLGGVTLLGDACHPMLPFLAQGAAMAIEDAFVLARMLREDSDSTGALKRYEAVRKPRTSAAQRGARRQAELFHLHRPADVVRRNLRLGIGSRLLPNTAMAQLDWLYGFDVTANHPQGSFP